MAIVLELSDSTYSFKREDAGNFSNSPAYKFMDTLENTKSVILDIKPAYPNDVRMVSYYTFYAYVGLTIKIETQCHNSSDDYREWEVATVAVPQEGGGYEFTSHSISSFTGFPSKADASPEIMAIYNAKVAYDARTKKVQSKLYDRKSDMNLAKTMGLKDRFAVSKLRLAVGQDTFSACITLLKTHKKGTLRSDFRKSIATQIVAWVAEPVNKYRSPLSKKQAEALLANASYGKPRYYR